MTNSGRLAERSALDIAEETGGSVSACLSKRQICSFTPWTARWRVDGDLPFAPALVPLQPVGLDVCAKASMQHLNHFALDSFLLIRLHEQMADVAANAQTERPNVSGSSFLLDEVEQRFGVSHLAVGEYHDLEGKVLEPLGHHCLDGRKDLCAAQVGVH